MGRFRRSHKPFDRLVCWSYPLLCPCYLMQALSYLIYKFFASVIYLFFGICMHVGKWFHIKSLQQSARIYLQPFQSGKKNEKLTFWDIDNCTKWATSATAINKNFSLLLTVLAVFDIIVYIQKQPPEVFYKKGVLRNFAKFTRKHLCQNLLFNKVRSATLLKRHPGKGVFLWILRNF